MRREPDYGTITPRELKDRLERGDRLELLDVREPWEFVAARIEGSRLIPLGEMPQRVSELDPHQETVVICHHGTRSAYVTQSLERSGFERVFNLEGGLDAYSQADENVPRY
ncbi:MAG: rhodanese-like domain-containing protein [Rubrobacteraceae bacterium]